jgi:hypothetical protein
MRDKGRVVLLATCSIVSRISNVLRRSRFARVTTFEALDLTPKVLLMPSQSGNPVAYPSTPPLQVWRPEHPEVGTVDRPAIKSIVILLADRWVCRADSLRLGCPTKYGRSTLQLKPHE